MYIAIKERKNKMAFELAANEAGVCMIGTPTGELSSGEGTYMQKYGMAGRDAVPYPNS